MCMDSVNTRGTSSIILDSITFSRVLLPGSSSSSNDVFFVPTRHSTSHLHTIRTQTLSANMTLSSSKARCVRCSYSNSDICIAGCANHCSYHARCIDLISLSRSVRHNHVGSTTIPVAEKEAIFDICPCCSSPASGLEILPLSLDDLDRARLAGGSVTSDTDAGGSNDGDIGLLPLSTSSTTSSKRRRPESDEFDSSFIGDEEAQRAMTYTTSGLSYDPSSLRTGRWTTEEITFRDTLVSHFLTGSLPLHNGCKLIDFLSDMLQSKQSRLTKKMKHAKLSAQHYFVTNGFIVDDRQAKELSKLEDTFIQSILDPVERSQIAFHMSKQWRDHIVERLTYLRIPFLASRWIKSVEYMEYRVNIMKNREKAVMRRVKMGRALEMDCKENGEGIFINFGLDAASSIKSNGEINDAIITVNGGNKEELDFDWFISNLEKNQFVGDLDGSSNLEMKSVYSSFVNSGNDDLRESMGSESNIMNISAQSIRPSPPSSTSSDPNFRFAAPFLAWITYYIEKNNLPFEHVDIWVPSSSPFENGSMSMGSLPSNYHGAEHTTSTHCRLHFAGSASMKVQMIPIATGNTNSCDSITQKSSDFGDTTKPSSPFTIAPLSSDEIESLSLFGHYSEKFSFNIGCGLPGRVFLSGLPVWEQFISNAPPALFERRGGAMQFGIQTALGLPIKSVNVEKIVLVLYSKFNREKDDDVVLKLVRDIQGMNPCPRWKLVVDMGSGKASNELNGSSINSSEFKDKELNQRGRSPILMRPRHSFSDSLSQPQQFPSPNYESNSSALNKNAQISSLIFFLGEHMPSEETSPVRQVLHSIMSLRHILLKMNRIPPEEDLVESILVLFQSYVSAKRTPCETILMLARDFSFHNEQVSQLSMKYHQSIPQARGWTVPQHSIGTAPAGNSLHGTLQQSCSVPYRLKEQGYESFKSTNVNRRSQNSPSSLTSIDHSSHSSLDKSHSFFVNSKNYS